MYTKIIKLAGLPVRINFNYSFFDKMSKAYECDEEPCMTVDVTEQDIFDERARADEGEWSSAYLESLAVYRKFCSAAFEKDVILFHGSVLAVDGKAYAFTAPSGTGKSTHAAIWRKLLGDKVITVNDDKPLIRIIGGSVRVYGTPWNGKHNLGAPVDFELGGIAILSRAKTNEIECVSPYAVIDKLLSQCHRGDSESENVLALDVALKILEQVPVYSLKCNMDDEAGKVSILGMTGIKI